ncbi:sigma 54 modulation/S30EA ribosomal C-terminal domain-containing protein [Nocardia neocaledoniensis]|uniref:sigma 54 modulation/S30EA ribosomal C-terminal domain-containing protein n=1 Tax=Nocardia neocaledoniensis TaxID=236511 RepID=UPI0024573307|nr:sigma 54 modulation/S30EA ribosomal C-terminal domain-containing protein [Nocardia neocaledoniensis]
MGSSDLLSRFLLVPGATVSVRGVVPGAEFERLGAEIGRTLREFGADRSVRVRVGRASGGDCPLLVQVNLTLDGTAVRAQTAAPADRVAAAVAKRLRRQIVGALRWSPRPWPVATATRPPVLFPGELTRRKRVTPRVLSPAAAIRTMDSLDYDVHLFVDSETGEDAIVYRGGPWGLRLARQRDLRPPAALSVSGPPVPTLDVRAAPILDESAAVARICDHALPFLFYHDPGTGRGALLYRRFDGGLASLSSAAELGENSPPGTDAEPGGHSSPSARRRARVDTTTNVHP